MSAVQTFEETVELLGRPEAYDPAPEEVSCVQTHGACVFLAGRWAYKMKKPVKYAFFDFSTLRKRRAALERELRLNRRLEPEMYREVLPVLRDGERLYVGQEGEEGEAVEFVLRMRRLPEDRFLPALLARGEAGTEDLARIARKVAVFHLRAQRGEHIARYGAPDALRRMFLDNLRECGELPPALRPDEGTLDACRTAFERALRQLHPVFEQRAAEGFVRDVHGDLRMEHVVLLDGDVAIFDCLDFRDDFRCMDTAHELASLLMEMRQAGYEEQARTVLTAYLDRTADDAALPLLPVYLLHRSLVRGKVEALKAGSEGLDREAHRAAAGLSRSHFAAAAGIATRERRPRLVVVCGLMASGKSALARGLAKTAGMALFQSDVLRKRIAGLEPATPSPDPWGGGLYDAGMTRRVYDELRQRAERTLASGCDAAVDASFSKRAEREAFAAVADRLGARLRFVECASPREERRARLERRAARAASVSDGRAEIMEAQEAAFEPWGETERLVLDTSGRKDASLRQALRALYAE